MGVSTVVCVLLLNAVFISTLAEKHSLFYIYSALNKDMDLPGIYEFTALGLLDDREIDYYNSKEQKKIPKQSWMMEKMQEDYWDKGTLSRKSKEQWFKVNVDILMQRMNHNSTDLHVLQWRHGCEVDESNGEVKFERGIDEYSYDGSEFLSFDDENMRWIAPVQAAEITKRKWDGVAILNQYTKGYLEKECVDWLTKFMEYGKETLRKQSPPVVHAFATKSVRDPKKLRLTCLATGFYPKDVELCVRKFGTSLPEHLLTSSGIRPNDDGTYQLRKSAEINGDDPADYDCYVNHTTLEKPVITKWVKPNNGAGPALIGGGAGGLIVILLIVLGVLFVLKKKGMIGGAGPQQVIYTVPQHQCDPANPPRPDVPNGHGNGVNVSIETEEPNGEGTKNGGSDSDSGRGSNSPQGSDENIPKKSEGNYSTGSLSNYIYIYHYQYTDVSNKVATVNESTCHC
ncbi:zinc-alpha-2-glycoprotein-like isoform X2 [Astyanax mexicanus]|uniref:zinc-alpha-2-glycoprotein-like isoform X2 n=1 Tax=Astyanax mexicanus TaxID=7994 RepID=UPI0020CAD79D|nr:zinc-alpha-2-glycoprotein-like isoform X2 [Astyanax mexicanus]